MDMRALQSYELFDLTYAAIESFCGGTLGRTNELVAEFTAWVENWQDLPLHAEMEHAAGILSDIFFLGRFPHIPVRWDPRAHRKRGVYGEVDTQDETELPQRIVIDPGDWSKEQGVRDHKSSIIGTLLHELCHVFLGFYGCVGGCGSKVCYAQRVGQHTCHGEAWFALASHVEFMARRLFPDLDIRLGIVDGILRERRVSKRVPEQGFWYALAERVSNDEIEDFLDDITDEKEKRLDRAYRGTLLLEVHGFRAGIAQMVLWARNVESMANLACC